MFRPGWRVPGGGASLGPSKRGLLDFHHASPEAVARVAAFHPRLIAGSPPSRFTQLFHAAPWPSLAAARHADGSQAERGRMSIDTTPPPSLTDRDHLLRLTDVVRITSLSRSTIYWCVKERRFPAPIRVGRRCSRWVVGDVLRWLADQQGSGKTESIRDAMSAQSPYSQRKST